MKRQDQSATYTGMKNEVIDLRARVVLLELTLKPFAAHTWNIREDEADSVPVAARLDSPAISVGDVRRARAVLARSQEPQK